jgi:hypothetical protein
MRLDGSSEPFLRSFEDVDKNAKEDVVHQVFHGVFENWQVRAGVLSATPDAPVVPDDPPGRWRRRLGALLTGWAVR